MLNKLLAKCIRGAFALLFEETAHLQALEAKYDEKIGFLESELAKVNQELKVVRVLATTKANDGLPYGSQHQELKVVRVLATTKANDGLPYGSQPHYPPPHHPYIYRQPYRGARVDFPEKGTKENPHEFEITSAANPFSDVLSDPSTQKMKQIVADTLEHNFMARLNAANKKASQLAASAVT